MSKPLPHYPMQEVHVRPPCSTNPQEPLVTLERDSDGRWWHTVAGEVVREATCLEVLLPASPRTWRRLGTPSAEPVLCACSWDPLGPCTRPAARWWHWSTGERELLCPEHYAAAAQADGARQVDP